jgi:hypothetical protein
MTSEIKHIDLKKEEIKKEVSTFGDSFLFLSSEIIYIEDHFYPEMNNFIISNFDMISSFFSKNDKVFNYIPFLTDDFNSLISYNFPHISKKSLDEYKASIGIQEIYSFLYQNSEKVSEKNAYCGFVECGFIRIENPSFTFYSFLGKSENILFWNTFNDFFAKKHAILKDDGPLLTYPRSNRFDYDNEIEPGHFADENFSEYAINVISEIKDRISYLSNLGLSHIALQRILGLDSNIKLSRIVITRKYRIFLPDYNNMEIKMRPLPKAVYILFLNHPQGICFKDLPDYRNELSEIYKKISKRENSEKNFQSIEDLTNPYKNSINEKCSRIREAFLSKFNSEIAKYYYITGERSTPKKILIDRSFVYLED